MEWWKMSAVEVASAIKNGQAKAVEILESNLERLDAVNSEVNAVVYDLREEALKIAREADSMLEQGKPLGILHGVPITTKENSDQKGVPTTDGLPAFAKNIAKSDSPQIANLKKAGAIVFGRTNTPEFAMRFHTDNPLHGATLNPWDKSVTPGGSSGGAAVAVALGIGALAHGNDVGGSLRFPAYCNGVVSLKPSFGVVPEYCETHGAEWPVAIKIMHSQGVIAREIRDLKLALKALIKKDLRDPWWVPMPPSLPEKKEALRVAVSTNPGGLGVDPAVAAAVQEAAQHLEDAGYPVEEVDNLPCIEEFVPMWSKLLFTELKVTTEEYAEKYGSPELKLTFKLYFEAEKPCDLAQYIAVFSERTRIIREWDLFFEKYPLVLTPYSCEPPFPLSKEPANVGTVERLKQWHNAIRMSVGMNLTGHPAAAVPTGLHEGIPIGVQIAGRRFRDEQVLDAAEAIENATGVLCKKLWERI